MARSAGVEGLHVRRGSIAVARRGMVVVMVLALLGVGGLAPRAEAASGEAIVATDVLNVRAEPWLGAEILNQVVWGESLWILDGPTEGNWYHVSYWGDFTGWVFGDYLSIGGVGGYAVKAPMSGDAGLSISGWVGADALNVRASPSQSADAIDLVWSGDTVTVIGYEENGYVPISHWSGNAWILASSVAYDGPAGAERWIDIDRSSSMVTLFEGDIAIASYWSAQGRDQSDDGFYATANGTYYVFSKEQGLVWTDWGQVYITDWVGFDPYRHNGFHSYSKDENGNIMENGSAPTGGCVALGPGASSAVFDFARLGTRVEVHW